MKTIVTFILQDRSRAGALARAAMLSGGWLLIAGALGAVLMKAFTARLVQAGEEAPASLGEMFPQVPLFWVPEGPAGYAMAGLVLLAGIRLAILADRLHRH